MNEIKERIASLSKEKRALLEQRLAESASAKCRTVPIPHATTGAAIPSFGQERLWALEQIESGTSRYNVCFWLELKGELDCDALAKALNAVVDRHETLRTRYLCDKDGSLQLEFRPASEFQMGISDLSGIEKETRAQALDAALLEEANQVIVLDRDPLFRSTLYRLDNRRHVLQLINHHVTLDGWSIEVLLRDLAAFYNAEVTGTTAGLPELPITFSDYARWQRQELAGPEGERLNAFWKNHLDGASFALQLPTDRPRAARQTFRGSVGRYAMTPSLVGAIQDFCLREEATPFMVTLAAVFAVLARYTGQSDLLIGSPIAARSRIESEDLVGFITNTVLLRGNLDGDPDFRELLRRVKKTTLDAYEHQELPLQLLLETLGAGRDLSRSALFQVMLVFQNAPVRAADFHGLETQVQELKPDASMFDFTIELIPSKGEFDGLIQYNADLFDSATIDRLWGHFVTYLERAIAAPDEKAAAISLLPPGERAQVLDEWNRTSRDYRPACVHQLVEEQVERSPDAVAVVCGKKSVSYRELNARANQVAHFLMERGAGPDVPVAIYVERTTDMLVGLLGILKAGSAYVPIDPGNPKERMQYVLEDVRAQLVLTESSLAEKLPEFEGEKILLDADWERIARHDAGNPDVCVTPRNLAYVLFTSGSTGRPKGVALEHRTPATFIRWALETFTPRELAGVLCSTSICFDVSMFEMFVTLSAGGRVILAPNLLHLQTLPGRNQVTLINAVPSAMRELVHTGWIPDSVLTVNLAGEAVPEELVEQILTLTRASKVNNLYGPTETSYATWTPLEAGERVTIGRPIANTRIYVLDGLRNPAPIGVPGEIYIAGDGVARGYINAPELTAAKFVQDPFGIEAGSRLYRTGDLGRYLPDGCLEFLGRADNQVKIRGYRIELGEIETALEKQPGIEQAIVVVSQDKAGDQRLVAYLAGARGAGHGASKLRELLKASLPEYMIPSHFVFLARLPMSPNGKIDRRALPSPEKTDAHANEEEYAAPRTPTELKLAAIWEEVLRRTKVGAKDNFFLIGGHSLAAMRIRARICQGFDLDLPVSLLFEKPTIESLAIAIDGMRASARNDEDVIRVLNEIDKMQPSKPEDRWQSMPEINQRIIGLSPEKRALLEKRLAEPTPARDRQARIERKTNATPVPSYGQETLWALEMIESGGAQYNISHSLHMEGDLDIRALQNALRALMNRHETLRAVYRTSADGRQTIEFMPAPEFSLKTIDLRDGEQATRELRLQSAIQEEGNRHIALDRGPLLRAVLYRLGERKHVLQLTVHHVASDGWSMGILFRDFSAFYNAEVTGATAKLPELPIAFSDYARWQREQMAGPEGERLISYWKNQVSGSSFVLQLPTDRPRPAKRTFRGAVRQYSVSPSLAFAMHEFCLREGVTPFMLALAAYYAVLARYSGQNDIMIGSPIAARSRIETEELVGFFTNTVLLRGNLDGDPTFAELLQRVKKTTLEAYAHQDLPLELLIDKIVPEREASRSALFQVMLVFQNAPLHRLELHGLETPVQEVRNDTAKFELTVALTPSGEALDAVIEYNTDLFDSGTIDRLWGHLTAYLEQAIAAPERKAAAISLMTSAERNQVLVEWNATKRPYPRKTSVAALVEAQVERTPDAIALIYGEERMTYWELNKRANRLAHRLLRRRVLPREKVGIAIERSPELIVGILAILKAGAAYVPIDLAYPLERRDFMMRDCGVRFLLTAQAGAPFVTGCEVEIIDARFDTGDADERDDENSPSRAGLDSPAYVMYTSGSTGRPKGVEIPHRGIVRLLVGSEFAELNEKQVFLQLAPVSFDASTLEIWGALLHGAKLVLFAGSAVDVDELGAALSRHGVTILWLTSSLFNAIVDREPGCLAPVRQLLVGGEALSVPHVIRAMRALPNTKLVNGYGPTESTTFACCYPIPRDLDPASSSIPIGRPIANTRVYILDGALQPLPVGVVGNLYIGGDGLALGYLNLSELTKESFIANPFVPNERIYKTGDLVRYLPDGNLEFVGRADHQVKIRGYRIELGEIEKALKEQLKVDQAVVMAREDEPGNKRLVAYLVAPAGMTPATQEVRRRLKQCLPDYLVPASYVFLEEFPISRNGKIDRQALPAPEKVGISRATDSGAPRDSLEETLVRIWADVLGMQQVGIRDNFFEMGGQSVLAVQLFARILAVIPECQPSLALLVKAPTVEQFARTLRGAATEWSYLVPMREGTERPPFFCVHGAGGHVLIMRDLAMAMPPDQPFYCLQSRGLEGDSAPFSTVEEAAECYVEEIRRIQPHGPYFLGGRSSGGAVAYEMARRLQSMGETVGVVALFDTLNFAYPRLISKPKLLYFNLCLFLYRLRHHVKIVEQMRLRDWVGYLAGRARIIPRWVGNQVRLAKGQKRDLATTGIEPPEPEEFDGQVDWKEALNRVIDANTLAAKKFIPKPYSGHLLVFRAKNQDGYLYQDKTLGWRPVALGGITTYEIDGDHHSIIRNPNVSVLAAKLDHAIREAQRGPEQSVQREEQVLVSQES